MQEEETKGILRECDAGVKMGIESIDAVVEKVKNPELKNALLESRKEHMQLQNEISEALTEHGWTGKEPPVMADLMSRMKIGAELLMDPSDQTIADLMYEGCEMGIKKLSEYVNRFPHSKSPAVHVAERLIKSEQELSDAVRVFL